MPPCTSSIHEKRYDECSVSISIVSYRAMLSSLVVLIVKAKSEVLRHFVAFYSPKPRRILDSKTDDIPSHNCLAMCEKWFPCWHVTV